MTTYDLGDGVPLEQEIRNSDGTLTNTTVVITLTRPDGTTFPAPTITNPSTGIFRATPVPDQVGTWAGVWTASGTVVSVTPFWFSIADPAPAAYTTLPTVKSALGKLTADDRDDLIAGAIAAASRMIDRRCGRYFYADRTSSTRTFLACERTYYSELDQVVMVDDISTATGVTVSVGTPGSYSALNSFELGPFNAPVTAAPYTEIRAPLGWAVGYLRVQVTAKWGWPAVPDEIAQAATLLASRIYRRKDSPQGVIASADWGSVRVSRTDPDMEALIAPYVLPVLA